MVSAAYGRFPAAEIATLANFRRHLDHALNEVATPAGNCAAPTDVVETPDELRFVLEVPGMRAQDIELTVEDGVLTVTGEKQPVAGDGSAPVTLRLSERRYGRFARQFRLPRTADAGGIKATCDHGLLTIRVPRAEAAKARRIAVDGAASAAWSSHEVAGA